MADDTPAELVRQIMALVEIVEEAGERLPVGKRREVYMLIEEALIDVFRGGRQPHEKN